LDVVSDAFWEEVYIRAGDVIQRQIAGETLLIPIRGQLALLDRIFALNPVAAFIWEQLDGRRSMGDIRQGVLAAFAVAPESAEADIREFVDSLRQANLIRGGA
jgi:hypothetical protein